jgi:hypothetical protein
MQMMWGGCRARRGAGNREADALGAAICHIYAGRFNALVARAPVARRRPRPSHGVAAMIARLAGRLVQKSPRR